MKYTNQLINLLLKRHDAQEEKMKAIKYGLIAGGIAAALGVGTLLWLKIPRPVKFIKHRIGIEPVAEYQRSKSKTRKIKIEEE